MSVIQSRFPLGFSISFILLISTNAGALTLMVPESLTLREAILAAGAVFHGFCSATAVGPAVMAAIPRSDFLLPGSY